MFKLFTIASILGLAKPEEKETCARTRIYNQEGNGRKRTQHTDPLFSEPPQKRKRCVKEKYVQRVDNILNEEGFTPKEFEFYNQISNAFVKSDKLKCGRQIGRYLIKDLEKLNAEPTEVLSEIFDHGIEDTLAKCEDNGYRPDRLFVLIDSEALLDPICLHLNSLNEDNVDALYHEFFKVDISNRMKGLPSLFDEVFTLDITAYAVEQLRQEKDAAKTRHPGAGKNMPKVPHCIEKSMIRMMQMIITVSLEQFILL